MAFTQNNNNFGQANNNNGGEQTKSNFRIGKIYGTDGIVETSCWKSGNGVLYISMSIRQQIGKDPQGRTNFESGLAKERPSVLMRADNARAFYEYLAARKPETINVEFAPWADNPNSKISVIGSNNNVKVIITDQKGKRELNVESTPIGGEYVNGNWLNFLAQFKKAIDSSVLARVAEELNNGEETPF
jgi:hypothetical protein